MILSKKAHAERYGWSNTSHDCSPGTCGHQRATKHIDCSDKWHKILSEKTTFACPTCNVS